MGLLMLVRRARQPSPNEGWKGGTELQPVDRVTLTLERGQKRQQRLQIGRRTTQAPRQATGVLLPGHRRRALGPPHTQLEDRNRGAELTAMDDGTMLETGLTTARAEVGSKTSRVIKEGNGEAIGRQDRGMAG